MFCPLVREKVIAEFGDEVYNANGLDRVKLAQIVFGNAEKLQKLNQIVHPEVKKNSGMGDGAFRNDFCLWNVPFFWRQL